MYKFSCPVLNLRTQPFVATYVLPNIIALPVCVT